ncbi:MAG: ParB-like nuclease domain-containing protein [Leptospiraceae bacterium]|nr:ParB-like nuclease domain-containing protein [Leptospiraceae bacterium]
MTNSKTLEQKLHETKDYGIFKYIPQNRKTMSEHVLKLAHSIKTKNLIKDFPILVNDKMEILDGQNRLQALQQLDYPVYYRIANDMVIDDISLVNTVSKKWSLDDYLHQYISKGFSEYLKFKDFMDWANISSVNLALKIIKNRKMKLSKQMAGGESNPGGIGADGFTTNKFKIGQFAYPESDSDAKNTIMELRQLAAFTIKKNPYDRSLIVAYDSITRGSDFEINRLLGKLAAYPIGVYNDANSLIDQFEKAYNYNVSENKKTFLKRY